MEFIKRVRASTASSKIPSAKRTSGSASLGIAMEIVIEASSRARYRSDEGSAGHLLTVLVVEMFD